MLLVFADFVINENVIVFPPAATNQIHCTNVTIVSDATLENEETFCLTINSLDPNVIIGAISMTTCITIDDIDSMLKFS